MNKKFIVSALVAAVFGSGAPAFAQDHYRSDRDTNMQQRDGDRSYERSNSEWQDQRSNSGWQDDRDSARDSNWRARRDYERQRRWEARQRHRHHRDEMAGGWGRTESFNAGYDGAGPYHNLRRGERLPSRYRTNQYVVDNWYGHHLTRPPRGYHWVQTGADYVLVGVSSGIIAQIMLGQ